MRSLLHQFGVMPSCWSRNTEHSHFCRQGCPFQPKPVSCAIRPAHYPIGLAQCVCRSRPSAMWRSPATSSLGTGPLGVLTACWVRPNSCVVVWTTALCLHILRCWLGATHCESSVLLV